MNFEKEVIKASETEPILVDFYANWCSPCKMLTPVIESASQTSGVKLVKINIDENQGLAEVLEIHSIPAVLMYNKGQLVGRFGGFRAKPYIDDFIKTSLGK